MDASLSPAAAPLASPLPQSLSPATPPWEIDLAEAPAPVRKAAGKPVRTMTAKVQAEPLPWTMIALTIVTAVLVILGSRATETSASRVMPLTSVR